MKRASRDVSKRLRLPWRLIGLAVLLVALVALALARRGPDSSVAQEAEPEQIHAEPVSSGDSSGDSGGDSTGTGEVDSDESSRNLSDAFEKLLRPAIDPESVPDTLRVRFLDGRQSRKLATIKRQDGVYLDINDLVPLAGAGYAWDPEAYRGYIDVDSVGINFALDTPLFWAGSEVLQLSAPVRYADEHLLMPYDFLERILIPTLGERAVWKEKSGDLLLAAERPWIRTLEITRENDRVFVTVGPSAETSHRVRWDPQGRLELQVRGLSLPPNFKAPDPKVTGLRSVEVRPTHEGFELLAALDPSWIGARSRDFPESGTFRVELTNSIDPVEKGDFELLTTFYDPAGQAGSVTGGRVLLEVSPPRSSDGERYLEQLADELRRVLEDEFRHEVEFVRDRKSAGRQRGRYGLPEMPPVPDGDCWLGLRLESYPSGAANDILLVHSGTPPRFEDLTSQVPAPGAPIVSPSGGQVLALPETAGQSRGQRMVPWGQVPRLFTGQSAQFAEALAGHLESDLKFRPVRTVRRPARVFRGMAMPGVLVYPAVLEDEAGLRALSSRAQVEATARALAFGIDEFLRTRRGGRR